MNSVVNHSGFKNLPSFDDVGDTGIYYLKRMFTCAQQAKNQRAKGADPLQEWSLTLLVSDKLGVGLEATISKLYSCDNFSEFEKWVIDSVPSSIIATVTQSINQAVKSHFQQAPNGLMGNANNSFTALTKSQLQHWRDFGYIVVPNVIDKSLCQAARQLAFDVIGAAPQQPASWYQSNGKHRGIMVQSFDHVIQTQIRQSPKIHAVFAALWQNHKLQCSSDRMGFNPPETNTWRFPGPNLHWDINFNQPLKFATQGLIYLNDVTAEGGAFSCVPGFHHKFESWYQDLPEGCDPQQQSWSEWPVKPIVAKAGSLIVWHHFLPHGSSPNHAAEPRVVQYINMYPA